jgi:hypothetical protein
MTFNSQIYELRESEGHKVWTRQVDFFPTYFFDNYKITESGNGILSSEGYQDQELKLNVKKTKKISNESVHYLGLDKESEVTSSACLVNLKTKPITITALIKNISRIYPNKENIPTNEYANIFSFKSRTSNINVGLCYDKDFYLYFYDNMKKNKVGNFSFSSLHTYQLGLKIFKKKAWVVVDNQTFGPFTITNDTYNIEFSFAVGNDQYYSKYQNGSFEFAELSLFDFLITEEEHLWLKTYPRSWNFNQYYSPIIDLTFEQKQELKNNLEKFLHQDENLNKLQTDVADKLSAFQEELRKKISTEVDTLLEELRKKQDEIDTIKKDLQEKVSALSDKLSTTEFYEKLKELEKLKTLKEESVNEAKKLIKALEEKIQTSISDKISFKETKQEHDEKHNIDFFFKDNYANIALHNQYTGNDYNIDKQRISILKIPMNDKVHLKYKIGDKEPTIWDTENLNPGDYLKKNIVVHDHKLETTETIPSSKALFELRKEVQQGIASSLDEEKFQRMFEPFKVQFQQEIEKLKKKCPHEVGDLYITSSERNPTSIWPETQWKKIEGTFIRASSNRERAGNTGGQDQVVLTKENLPSISVSGTTKSSGAHVHETKEHKHSRGNMEIEGRFDAVRRGGGEGQSPSPSGAFKQDAKWGTWMRTGEGDDWGSTYSFRASDSWTGHTTAEKIEIQESGEHIHTFETNFLGSSKAFDNRPGYTVFNVWERIA